MHPQPTIVKFRIALRHAGKALRKIRAAEHRAVARTAVAGHLVYYALVYVESHGLYGKAALFCGVILLIEAALGGGVAEE